MNLVAILFHPRLTLLQGRGVVEFSNGDLMSGFFEDGRRKGEFRVETFRNKMRVIIGNYERDQLNGKARVSRMISDR